MAAQTWKAKDFSMRPVDPAAIAGATCTRTLNMDLRSDGMLVKRPAFNPSTALPATTRNHIVFVDAAGLTRLVVKTDSAIQHSDGVAGFTSLAVPAADLPVGGVTPTAAIRGSFAIHGTDLYYCDESLLLAWDGLLVRRPGVVGLDGIRYNGPSPVDGGLPAGHPAIPAGGGGATFPFGLAIEANYGPPIANSGGTPPFNYPSLCNPITANRCLLDCAGGFDPCIIIPYPPAGIPRAMSDVGEKTLNTAFALSFYDPKRDTFGRRTDAFALPYLFSGKHIDDPGVAPILARARTQYSKRVKTPSQPAAHNDALEGAAGGYKVAIWFTRGLLPAAEVESAVSGGWWAATFGIPSMSRRMNETLFLETIAQAGLTSPTNSVICKKGDTSLFESARYIDIFARPVPARHLLILPSGTAIYLFPRTIATRAISQTAEVSPATVLLQPLGNYAEFSVRHPEQIGRNTDSQQDTRSSLPNLRGRPLTSFIEGGRGILFTTQAVYHIGFSDGVALAEIGGGRGVRAQAGIARGTQGIVYVADDGLVWMNGDKMVLIDQELGFGRWFEAMPAVIKATATVGICEATNQLFAFHIAMPGTGPSGQRALVFDYGQNFACEYRGSDINDPGYAAYFPAATSALLWTQKGAYPSLSPATEASLVELWVADEQARPKDFSFLELRTGPCPANTSLDITIEARDSTTSGPEYAAGGLPVSRSATILLPTAGGKSRITNFMGMRGRMFRLEIAAATPTTTWELAEVRAEYVETPEAEDARSV